MKRMSSLAAAAAAGLMITAAAHATAIGTASGDLVIHFNGAEVPANVTYTSTSNMVFNYDPGLVDAPASAGYGSNHYFQLSANQFRFEAVLNTVSGSGGPVTALNHNTPGTPTSTVDWAITDPGWNSHLRGGDGDDSNGSAITLTQNVTTPTATGFHLDLTGYLTTDGSVHWSTAATTPIAIFNNPNSPLNGWDGNIYFQGSFDYVTANDTTAGADTYTGTVNFATTSFAVPVPAAAPVGAVLLAGLGLTRRSRRLA